MLLLKRNIFYKFILPVLLIINKTGILEQKLEFLKRTQTSLNFGFFVQSAAHE